MELTRRSLLLGTAALGSGAALRLADVPAGDHVLRLQDPAGDEDMDLRRGWCET